MNKFISPRSRAALGGIFCLVGIVAVTAYVAMKTNHPTVASAALLVVIAFLIGVGYYFTHVQPTPLDLLDEAKRRVDQHRDAAMAWAGIQIQHAKFAQMSRGQKAGMIFAVYSGISFCLAGLADIAGLVKPLTMTAADGSHQIISHYLTGGFYVAMGIFALFFTSIIRIQVVDRIDEETRRLFRDMDAKGSTPQ